MLVMAHYRKDIDEVMRYSEDQLELMEASYLLLERRQVETLSDVVGTLLGTSWPVDALTGTSVNPELLGPRFTWAQRPERRRISMPLSLVMGGARLMEHLKKMAASQDLKGRVNPAVMKLPKGDWLKDAEVVELGTLSKDAFLQFARSSGVGS